MRLFHFKNDVAYAMHWNGLVEKNQGSNELLASEFTMYPNPALDVLELAYPDLSQTSSVFLYNGLGQLVYWQNLSGNHTSVLISAFPAGLYYLKAEYNGTTYNKKFIKSYEK